MFIGSICALIVAALVLVAYFVLSLHFNIVTIAKVNNTTVKEIYKLFADTVSDDDQVSKAAEAKLDEYDDVLEKWKANNA